MVGDRNESHAELSGSVVGRPLYAMEENNTQAESAMPGGKRIAYDNVDSDSDEDERGINQQYFLNRKTRKDSFSDEERDPQRPMDQEDVDDLFTDIRGQQIERMTNSTQRRKTS